MKCFHCDAADLRSSPYRRQPQHILQLYYRNNRLSNYKFFLFRNIVTVFQTRLARWETQNDPINHTQEFMLVLIEINKIEYLGKCLIICILCSVKMSKKKFTNYLRLTYASREC